MRRRLDRFGPPLAITGVGIIATAALMTALAYSGLDGENYRPWNHSVSELGEQVVSGLAPVFNTGMVLGGLLIAFSMLALTLSPATNGARLFGVLGAAAGVCVVLVGVFPVDDFEAHKIAAMLAFLSVTLVAAWFTAWMAFGRAPFARWLGAWSAWIVLAIAGFLVLPQVLQPGHTFQIEFDPDPPPRPDIWLAALLEWIVVASALAWIALIGWSRSTQRRGSQPASSATPSASKS